jgi:hypothetical protein
VAKSKKKSSKSKKSKQVKKGQQPKAHSKSLQAKKSPQKKMTQPAPASKSEAENKPTSNTTSNSKLIKKWWLPVLLVAIASVYIAFGTKSEEAIDIEVPPSPNTGSQQSIEVVDPVDGSGIPGSSGYNIQGSSPEGQQNAQGGLQTPSTNELQPNARIEDYENAQIN